MELAVHREVAVDELELQAVEEDTHKEAAVYLSESSRHT